MNARRAPEGIGEGHGADELGDLRIDGRTTGSTASRLPVPERAEALPVPANHGLRLNDMERFAPPCPPLREPQPEDAVEETDPRSLGAAAEQGELLSQRQVLKNEVGAGLQRSAQSAQQSEYEAHCYAGSLDRRPTSSVATDILANDKKPSAQTSPGWQSRLAMADIGTQLEFPLLSETRLNAALQTKPQETPSHVGVAFAGALHGVQETPQLFTLALKGQVCCPSGPQRCMPGGQSQTFGMLAPPLTV